MGVGWGDSSKLHHVEKKQENSDKRKQGKIPKLDVALDSQNTWVCLKLVFRTAYNSHCRRRIMISVLKNQVKAYLDAYIWLVL